MNVQLKDCGPIERRIKERGRDARRRILNAAPQRLVAPKAIQLPSTAEPDVTEQYQVIEWSPPREYRAHVVAWSQHCAAVKQAKTFYPHLHELETDMMKVCPVGWNEIISNRRHSLTVRWRQAFMEAAKRYTPRSLPEIGRHLGGKDHTTVLHGCRKVAEAYEDGRTEQYQGPCGYEFRLRV